MISGLHHFLSRKFLYQKLEPYPHPDKLKRILDKLIYVAGIAGPVMTIPQVTIIWVDKNASGVSLVTWIAYLIITIFWLFYGLVHKEKPIIISNILWIIFEVVIIAGIIMYS